MMMIPLTLTMMCMNTRFDTSVNTKWPAKDRKTPRQKIPSECWPHMIAGRAQADFSAGQSRGTK